MSLSTYAVRGAVTGSFSRPVKAIIFDCDGTLVDSEQAYFLALKQALKKYEIDLLPDEYSGFVGRSTGLDEEFISRKAGPGHIQEILADAMDNYLRRQAAGLAPIKHTYDFLHTLAKQKETLGVKLGVASAASKRDILMNLQNLGIESYFDIILSGQEDLDEYSDPEGVNKPKPYVYMHAAKALNVDVTECIAIEDSHTGVVSGADAGCFTVAVPNYFTVGHDLSRAHLTMESFEDVSVEGFLKIVNELRAKFS